VPNKPENFNDLTVKKFIDNRGRDGNGKLLTGLVIIIINLSRAAMCIIYWGLLLKLEGGKLLRPNFILRHCSQ
jgi:hypothetical protein